MTSRIVRWPDQLIPELSKMIARQYFKLVDYQSCDVMEEDWDTLLILDACRYDLFKNTNTLSGSLQSRLSKGSSTAEFLEKNFQNSHHSDTVYVTANPMHAVDRWCDVDLYNTFHDIIDVWEESWNEEFGTVHPKFVNEAAKSSHSKYPNKRIIVHYIQPHHPFIGEFGQQIAERGMRGKTVFEGEEDLQDEEKIWDKLRKGQVSKNDVRRAYQENLELVLTYVGDLISEIEGKTVITSDHGNHIGEFAKPLPVRLYGHPTGIHTDELVKVPWFVISTGERKKIESGTVNQSSSSQTERETIERLRALGYKE